MCISTFLPTSPSFPSLPSNPELPCIFQREHLIICSYQLKSFLTGSPGGPTGPACVMKNQIVREHATGQFVNCIELTGPILSAGSPGGPGGPLWKSQNCFNLFLCSYITYDSWYTVKQTQGNRYAQDPLVHDAKWWWLTRRTKALFSLLVLTSFVWILARPAGTLFHAVMAKVCSLGQYIVVGSPLLLLESKQ